MSRFSEQESMDGDSSHNVISMQHSLFQKALRKKIGKDQKKKHAVSMPFLIDPELLKKEKIWRKVFKSFFDATRTELLMGSHPEPPQGELKLDGVEFIDRAPKKQIVQNS